MTPSDRERLCTCLSFPPNHAPDCPRSPGERLREQFGDVDTCTGCGREEADCTCRSTGQTEEETSDGLQSGFSVGDVHRGSNNSDRDVARKPNLETGREVRNVVAAAPLTSQRVSASDWLETELYNFAHAAAIELGVDNGIGATSVAEEAIYRNMKMVCKIYASSSNAALRMNVTYERTLKEQWRVRCIAAESNQHEAETERDSLREALDEWKRQSLALVVLLKAKCSDAEWAGMNAKFDAALGDPPEKGTV